MDASLDLRSWAVPVLVVLAMLVIALRRRPRGPLERWLADQGLKLVGERLLHDLNRGKRTISKEDDESDLLLLVRDASGSTSERQVRQTDGPGHSTTFTWVS